MYIFLVHVTPKFCFLINLCPNYLIVLFTFFCILFLKFPALFCFLCQLTGLAIRLRAEKNKKVALTT